MTNVRQFSIKNQNGEEYVLLTREVFFHSVTGLGYSENTLYQQFVNRYKVIDAKFDQWAPAGYLLFSQPDAYGRYYRFTRFCQNSPLYLHYTPPGRPEYVMQVRLANVEKAELESGAINCRVVFRALTPFYRVVQVYNSAEIQGGKTYDYVYNYEYSDSIKQTIIIDSDSYTESPCKLTIYGPATNPSWRHYVNNVLFETGGISGVIAPNRKLVIDTTDLPYSITQQDLAGNVIQDMYGLSDFSTERFLLLQNGINTIVVAHEGTTDLRMEVEGMIEYATI